jgi:hypothetical protein
MLWADAEELVALGRDIVGHEAFPMEEIAAWRGRALLILHGEGVGPDSPSNTLQYLQGLALSTERLARGAPPDAAIRADMLLILLCDGAQIEVGEPGIDQVGREIILMQPLLDRDDDSLAFVVEARIEGFLIEPLHPLPLTQRVRIGSLHKIVDDEHICPKPRQACHPSLSNPGTKTAKAYGWSPRKVSASSGFGRFSDPLRQGWMTVLRPDTGRSRPRMVRLRYSAPCLPPFHRS